MDQAKESGNGHDTTTDVSQFFGNHQAERVEPPPEALTNEDPDKQGPRRGRGRPRIEKPAGYQTVVRGRKDRASKQEAVIETGVIGDRVQELVLLLQRAKDAGAAYNDGIKAAAEKAGLQSSVVRKFVEAKAGEHYDDKKRDAMQLVLLFDNVA